MGGEPLASRGSLEQPWRPWRALAALAALAALVAAVQAQVQVAGPGPAHRRAGETIKHTLWLAMARAFPFLLQALKTLTLTSERQRM